VPLMVAEEGGRLQLRGGEAEDLARLQRASWAIPGRRALYRP
jgi:hypothetical protein